ncbi:DUF6233 domain-containing protein [Streptomyces sp. NPDC093084]|uniref:DUF6233 domain-containing protein n=1 Tax=Streptomyces sp. NPDC093084 TaxID=3155197 RepID=UPI00343407B6
MNELPPDPPRLRAILAHLDTQLADTETVATYLRLQRDAVRAALSRADRTAAPRPVPAAPRQPRRQLPRSEPTGGTSGQQVGLVIEEQQEGGRPTGGMIHTAACMPHMHLRPISPDVARRALATDAAFFSPCPLCRPDTELGIDIA